MPNAATPPNLQSSAPIQGNPAPQFGRYPQAGAAEAALDHFRQFARERPEAVAMWAFGLGFVLGWKLRIW